VQLEPIEPTWKAPGPQRLILKCEKFLQSCAFEFNVRRYTEALKVNCTISTLRMADNHLSPDGCQMLLESLKVGTRGFHSSTSPLNQSRFRYWNRPAHPTKGAYVALRRGRV